MNKIARNPEIERLARELAARDGTSPDEAELQKLLADIGLIQEEYAALPFVDPDFTEDSLYDENGLPA